MLQTGQEYSKGNALYKMLPFGFWLNVPRALYMINKTENQDWIEEEEREASIDDKLRDYLDGYFLSFDLYPICQRHIYKKNDAYALYNDFLAVGGDMNRANQKLIRSSKSAQNSAQ